MGKFRVELDGEPAEFVAGVPCLYDSREDAKDGILQIRNTVEFYASASDGFILKNYKIVEIGASDEQA